MHFSIQSLLLVLLLAYVTAGQTSDGLKWERLTSNSADFSATIPAGYFVYNNTSEKDVSVSGYVQGASFSLHFERTSKSKEIIETLHGNLKEKGDHSDYLVGKSRVHFNSYLGEKIYRTSLGIGTEKGYYSVALAATSSDNPVLQAILASIQVDGEQIVKVPKVTVPSSDVTLKASSLKSSDEVQAALNRQQTISVSVQPGVPGPLEDKEIVYSRRLIILRKTVAKYNQAGRRNMVNGAVTLRVQFRADGYIGKIWVVKGLPDGLNEQAIIAAKEIRFLPAQVGGQPVDKEVDIEYSFVIY